MKPPEDKAMAWKVTARKYLIEEPWFTLRADACELPSGDTLDPYYIMESPDFIEVIAFDTQGRLLLIWQYRHGAGKVIAELPAGLQDRGETALQAAQRELREETGCTSEHWEPLLALYPNPARMSNQAHFFLARNARQTQPQQLEHSESIEPFWATIDEVFDLIDSGQFSQSYHVAGFFLALRKMDQLRLRPRGMSAV